MYVLIVLLVIGLCLGSFVNALVWRLYKQTKTSRTNKGNDDNRYSILLGRSMCPNCHHELAPRDLVPVFSWLWLCGKCRYCHKSISWQYPVVELLVALLFVLSYVCWPMGFGAVGVFSFVLWLIFLTAFVALGVYDLRWFILPDRIIYPLIGLALVEVIVRATIFSGGWQLVITAFWGIFFLAGLFGSLYVLSKGAWIGFGDVKLAIVLGLLVGGPLMALFLIFLASVLGSIVAIPLLINGRAKANTQIPFGPFLLVATVIIILSGTSFSNWFNNLFYLH
jgi:prepilin signal peptidase PulO-like enzyme (type II secretory pathway)